MVFRNKALIFSFLFFSMASLLQAGKVNTYPLSRFERQSAMFSSMVIGSLVGATCGIIDCKARLDSMPLTWVVSYFIRRSLVDAIQYEQGNDDAAMKDHAHSVAGACSWLAWAIVYSQILS